MNASSYMDGWKPVERAYSSWVRAAWTNAGSAAALGRALEDYLRKAYKLQPDGDLRELGVPELTGRTISRWEKGTRKKPQPQYPADPCSREALMAVVAARIPVPPMEMEWASFQDVCEAFDAERLERIERGAGNLGSHAAQGRTKDRHQFLATWPVPTRELDPIALGLGSWAFNGALPPYVERTIDSDLAARLKEPGITTVTGPPKSGKSRSILENLQRQHPDAITWWVNPSPAVLPLVVENANKAKGSERPAFIVLDDAGLIGTDPAGGLTAQRLMDLAACAHLIVVIHSKTLADWERQLVNRAPSDFASGGIGVTRELMDLLELRVHYVSVLDKEEAVPAAEVYDNANERVKSFDLTRLAETLAGVETLRKQATYWLETSTSVEAALLEAAIDASIAFPAGASEEILGHLTRVHYRRRQPNRPWREHLLGDAFDTLSTGISNGSPHAILVMTEHNAFRILDALAAELQHPGRDVLGTLTASKLRQEFLDVALINTGNWHWRNNQRDRATECWIAPASHGYQPTMVILGSMARDAGNTKVARMWWSRAADLGNAEAMVGLGGLDHLAGNEKGARSWWGRAADLGHVEAMCNLGVLADEAGDAATSLRWWKRAAGLGHAKSIFALVTLARETGDISAMRRWWERAAGSGHVEAMLGLGTLAYENGDTETTGKWWERAAGLGHVEAMYGLGTLAYETGDTKAAREWWNRAAEHDHPEAVRGLGNLAHDTGDTDTAEKWWNRAAELGNAKAMFGLGTLACENGDTETTGKWWERAAGLGHVEAMYGLGTLAYETGDTKAAREWWNRAAEHDHPEAVLGLGNLAHDTGDTDTAEKWWNRAAELGNAKAMFGLGSLAYETGDTKAAGKWWERAAGLGHPEAMFNIGTLAYVSGDKEGARAWWERAAESGSSEAMFNRGVLFRDAGDTQSARAWWERAADHGDTDAVIELEILAEEP